MSTCVRERQYVHLFMNVRDGMVIGVACVVSAATTVGVVNTTAFETVKTERLEIVDAKGAVRGVAATTDDGDIVLALTDKAGKPRIAVVVADDGTPSVALIDGKEQPVLAMAINEDSTAAFNLQDTKGTVRGALTIDEDGVVQLERYDKDGKRIK